MGSGGHNGDLDDDVPDLCTCGHCRNAHSSYNARTYVCRIASCKCQDYARAPRAFIPSTQPSTPACLHPDDCCVSYRLALHNTWAYWCSVCGAFKVGKSNWRLSGIAPKYTCQVCAAPVREGMRWCSGLSACWKKDNLP